MHLRHHHPAANLTAFAFCSAIVVAMRGYLILQDEQVQDYLRTVEHYSFQLQEAEEKVNKGYKLEDVRQAEQDTWQQLSNWKNYGIKGDDRQPELRH